MSRHGTLACTLLVLLLAVAPPPSCTALAPPPRAVVVPVTKDPATSLYTIPVRYYDDLVVDLSGPLIWSTCADDHLPASISCHDPTCLLANAFPSPSCKPTTTGGCATAADEKVCTAYPYNPVTGQCASGKLVHTRFIANTTDGKRPLTQASVKAIAACAPRSLLSSRRGFPARATGVAGLAATGLALPAQVASSQRAAAKFLLCLPRLGYNPGVAILGSGGPFYLDEGLPDFASTLDHTPLVTKNGSAAYHVTANAIALDDARLPLRPGAIAVAMSTSSPYGSLRRDVYRPLVRAFEAGLNRSDARVAAVAPFELCYRSASLWNTRIGYFVPAVRLVLAGGSNYTMTGTNSMVDVNRETACLAFVEMKGVNAGDASSPAVILGGFQMENMLLQFDLEKKRLGFVRLPYFTSCSNFNFTKAQ
uniref:Peptidase A1 domain-containing protein n=1 Tax=Leersia perrieri TaxID=77586 RepID=A0A0D9VA12_9ORYZ